MVKIHDISYAEEERLQMLAEECSEVIQVICKIFRHGYTSFHPDDETITTNWTLLKNELNDVKAIMYGMTEAGDYHSSDFSTREAEIVWAKKQKWTHYQNG